jgi:hypothetical protein
MNIMSLKKCIYCRESKNESEFTLEHIIPQFLGGACSPEAYKCRDVCKKCNSNLGLFVDANFEKNYLVYAYLKDAYRAFFVPGVSLPLLCMGSSDLHPPHMSIEDEVCETWLGPLGEQVFWIRPKDERLDSYMGGNPRTTKSEKTVAYFLCSQDTQMNPKETLCSFRDAFKERKVKKIMCTKTQGIDLKKYKFETPDDIDETRIRFFNEICLREEHVLHHEIVIKIDFEQRFLAKIAIGISYAFFGWKILETSYLEESYKVLWGKESDIFEGTSLLSPVDDDLILLLGEPYAVTLTIFCVENTVLLNINLGQTHMVSVKIALCDDITEEDRKKVGDGKVIIIYQPIKHCISIDYPDFLAHKTGDIINQKIQEISSLVNKYDIRKPLDSI